MNKNVWLADRFEEQWPHLRAGAYRMLGLLAEANDAVQDARLRVSRADASEVENFGGWLTMIVARISLKLRTALSHAELRLVLVNGAADVVVFIHDRSFSVMDFTVADGTIVEIDAIANRERVRRITTAVLNNEQSQPGSGRLIAAGIYFARSSQDGVRCLITACNQMCERN